MEIKKILVPVDGSDASKHALTDAIDMAKAHSAKLVLLAVADVTEAAYPIMGVTLDKDGFYNVKKKTEGMLEKLKETVPADIDLDAKVESGIPGTIISNAVEEEQVDIVVMGNSGKGAVSSFIMGSVSQYVIHHVKCPVLVVK